MALLRITTDRHYSYVLLELLTINFEFFSVSLVFLCCFGFV